MNFMSGSGLSTLLINRTIEDAGGTPFSTVSRHSAVVGYSVVPEKAVPLIPLLATDCTYEKWDMRDAKKLAAVVSNVANESNQILLTENLYAAAYGPQSPAGRSLYWSGCSNDTLKAFRARTYGLNGAVLAATGIKDHGAFCTEVENLFSESPVVTADAPAPMAYLGGESRVMHPGKRYADVALAFPAPPSSVLANVVAQFFNLASGKSGVSALAVPGLAGIYAGSNSPGTIMEEMCKTLKTPPTPDLIKRAKNRAKAEALFTLDGGSKSLASFMTSSVLESQILTGPVDVIKAYDAVTDKQVTDALTTMLKSNPSLAAVGDIALVPYQATVAAMLK
jgi:predicted Zn-dependent peptidase